MHACACEAVKEPGCGSVSEVVADGGLKRGQDLQQDEDDTRERERADQTVATLHGGDEHAHRDREDSRQNTAKQQD
ncbi:MAG: hypothetical protein ACR2L2_01020 [Acidobacteriota bacterium]